MLSIITNTYKELKEVFYKHGFILNKDYTFSDSSKSYNPKFNENGSKVFITYYGIGFEPIGEIILEKKEKIICIVEFPYLKIYEIIMVKVNNND